MSLPIPPPHESATRRWVGTVAVALLVLLASCGGDGSGRQGPGPAHPPAAPSGAQPVYVAVGASETVGVGSRQPLRDAWTRVLHRSALPRSAVFVNMGIPGATVSQAIGEQAPTAVGLRPSLVTVWVNVNDLIAGVPPDQFERQLETLVTTLGRQGATRVLVANVPPLDRLPAYLACRPDAPASGPPCRLGASLPPPAALAQFVDAYNQATARVAGRQRAFLVDLHGAGMVARQAGTETSLIAADGFHPNTAGHAAVASAFAEVLRRSGPLPQTAS